MMRRLRHALLTIVALCLAGSCTAAQTTTADLRFHGVAGVRNFPLEMYQAHRQNWAIVADNRGILYFGNTSGVLEFDGSRWRTISLPDGKGAYALGKAADGRILVGGEGEVGWLAPDASGIMQYVSRSADLPAEFRSTGDRVIRILDTPDGAVYLADHWLFVRSSNGSVTTLRPQDHFLQMSWFHGALYVLDSVRGLTRRNGAQLEDIPGGDRLRALSMIPTSSGLFIPSYIDGLVRYSPGGAKPFQPLEMHGWSVADNYEVTSAVAIQDNLLAFGTSKRGLVLIDPRVGVVSNLSTGEGLNDNHVYSLDYDGRGNLWMAMDNGISMVGLKLPRDSTALPFTAWVRKVIGTRDDRVIFGGTYFTTVGGVQQLPQSTAQKQKFPFKYNAFRFDYSANGLEAQGQMEFQTFMKGVDTDWSKWSTRDDREFTELRPGHWNFRVRARNAAGLVSAEGVYELTIEQPWYETWWFTLAQVAFVIIMLMLPGSAHRSKEFQEGLTTFSVIVPFSYVSAFLSGFIGHYSSGVVFFKVLMSSLLSFLLDPIKKRLKKNVEQRNARSKAKKEQRALKDKTRDGSS